jgi:hypothetical protein
MKTIEQDISSKYYLIIGFALLSFALLFIGTSSTMASIFFIFLGISLIFLNLRTINKHSDLNKWKKVDVDITAVDIVEKIEPDRFLDKVYYYPKVSFSYDYQNQTYWHGSFALDPKSFLFDEIESAETYLKNKLENCSNAYCNVNDPNQAYLEISLTSSRKYHFVTLIIAGLILCIIGIEVAFL